MRWVPRSVPPLKLARRTRQGILLVDVDGTITPYRRSPGDVRIGISMRSAITLAAYAQGVILVSGRPLASLEKLAPGLPVGLVGSHGAESNLGLLAKRPRSPLPQAVRRVVRAAEAAGLRTERKPYGASIHFRERPVRTRALELTLWLERLRDAATGWDVLAGEAVAEIRQPGIHKGLVIDALRRQGIRIAAALGDDATDEDMFAALRMGELGVLVGKPRISGAFWRLRNVGEVENYLRSLGRR